MRPGGRHARPAVLVCKHLLRSYLEGSDRLKLCGGPGIWIGQEQPAGRPCPSHAALPVCEGLQRTGQSACALFRCRHDHLFPSSNPLLLQLALGELVPHVIRVDKRPVQLKGVLQHALQPLIISPLNNHTHKHTPPRLQVDSHSLHASFNPHSHSWVHRSVHHLSMLETGSEVRMPQA